MKRFLLLMTLAVAGALAQTAPNCNQTNVILTAAGTGASFNATSVKCVAWTLSYFSEGFTVISIQIESAPDVNGVPGAWGAIAAGSIAQGTNPITSTVSGTLTVNGYFPWVRVNLVTATGTGKVNYSLIGNSYVGPASSATTGSGGGIAATVNGPDAAGAAPTKNAVQDSGVDGGGLVRRFLTNTGGSLTAVGSEAAGAVTAVNPVQVGGLDQANKVRPMGMLFNSGSGFQATMVTFHQGGTPGDAAANANCCASANETLSGIPLLINDMGGFNGTTWDRYRTASVTNFALANSIGARITERGGRWSMTNSPAGGVQAVATKAAGAAGVKHVLDTVCFGAQSSAAVVAVVNSVAVLDGATELWRWSAPAVVAAAAGAYINPPFCVSGLQLIGTAATAMTVQYNAATAGVNQTVSATGYDVN